MLGVHLLLAVGLAVFADALSPLGVAVAFVLILAALHLGSELLGLRRYVARLERGAGFAAWFAGAVFRAALDVARIALARRVAPRPAVVAIRLREPDARVATLLGCLLTLTPGTIALDYDADAGLMYVHALDAEDAAAVEASVRAIEARLLAWLHAGADDEAGADR